MEMLQLHVVEQRWRQNASCSTRGAVESQRVTRVEGGARKSGLPERRGSDARQPYEPRGLQRRASTLQLMARRRRISEPEQIRARLRAVGEAVLRRQRDLLLARAYCLLVLAGQVVQVRETPERRGGARVERRGRSRGLEGALRSTELLFRRGEQKEYLGVSRCSIGQGSQRLYRAARFSAGHERRVSCDARLEQRRVERPRACRARFRLGQDSGRVHQFAK